ncbi:hypothetical protein K7432_006942 [Basidiobolus ranarum]|uniref:Uncharacterized protein n=1 Tax=Basidiobolus ranarum TaxID=34480 RepID=A0ABR2WUA7_9FUNG
MQATIPGSQPLQQPLYQNLNNEVGQRSDQQQYCTTDRQQSQYIVLQQQQAPTIIYHEGNQYILSNALSQSIASDNSYISIPPTLPQQGFQQQLQFQHQRYQQSYQDPRLIENSLGQQVYHYQAGSIAQTGQQVQQPAQQERNYPVYQQVRVQAYDISPQRHQSTNGQQQPQVTTGPQIYQLQQYYSNIPHQSPGGYVNPPPQGWQQGPSPPQNLTHHQPPIGNQYQASVVAQGQPSIPQQQYQQQLQWSTYPQQQSPQGNFNG